MRIVRGPVVRHTWYPFRAVTSGFERWPVLSGEPTNAVDLPDPDLRTATVCVGAISTRTKFLMAEEKSRAKLLRFQEAGFMCGR